MLNVIESYEIEILLFEIYKTKFYNFYVFEAYILLCSGQSGAKNGNSWRSGSDLSKLYDTATPNPTGSLSGPYFLQKPGATVTGTRAVRAVQCQFYINL